MEEIFPPEIWLTILEHLNLPDLHHLALSCKRLHQICSPKLQAAFELYQQYRCIEGPREYFEDTPYHDLLCKILREEVPATFIEEIHVDNLRKFAYETPDPSSDGESVDPANPLRLHNLERPLQVVGNHFFKNEEERRLVRLAVAASPWITDEEKAAGKYFDTLAAGNEDAVLGLLLPLLPNLRSINVKSDMKIVSRVVGRIAQATSQAPTNRQPLSKVVLVLSTSGGLELEFLVPFAALPSVQRIAASVDAQHFEGWPARFPRSKARQVFFSRSRVFPAAVQAFAKGFQGPCMMMQDCSIQWVPNEVSYEKVTWDHYEISEEVSTDGTRAESFQSKFTYQNHLDWIRTNNESRGSVHPPPHTPSPEFMKTMAGFVDGSLAAPPLHYWTPFTLKGPADDHEDNLRRYAKLARNK